MGVVGRVHVWVWWGTSYGVAKTRLAIATLMLEQRVARFKLGRDGYMWSAQITLSKSFEVLPSK